MFSSKFPKLLRFIKIILSGTTILFGTFLQANTCVKYLNSSDNKGAELLRRKNSQLHTTGYISRAAIRLARSRSALHSPPVQKISAFIHSLGFNHIRARNDKTYLEWFKGKLYNKYVIKSEDVPESFFNLQVQIAANEGHGHIVLSEDDKKRLAEVIIKDQKSSLDVWIDYFISPDSDSYPMWFKFWAFQGLVKLGKYDDERGVFFKRNKGTTNMFPDLNSEILTLIADSVIQKLNGKSLDDLEDHDFRRLVEKENFVDLYTYEYTRVKNIVLDLSSTEGIWKRFDKGSDPKLLTEALKNKATGWCTAGIGFAEKQIAAGDFHIFFTKDDEGNFKQPRIAIRMEDSKIKQIRGIAKDQNLDDRIASSNALDEKLKEFGKESEEYKIKTLHMKKLTVIKDKHDQGFILANEDLRFLYEIDEKIQGFGYGSDPRINEILKDRNTKIDLSIFFACRPDQISLTDEEALSGDIIYHHGSLFLSDLTSSDGLTLPKSIKFDLYLEGLGSADGLILPEGIGGELSLSNLTSADGLILPNIIGGGLHLNSLTSAVRLIFPKSIGGHLSLGSLTSANGIILPESVRGDLSLTNLTSTSGLTLPNSVGGNLYLGNLTSAIELILPKSVGGTLYLQRLTSAEGITLPHSVGGSLYLGSLISAIELILPKSVGGDLYLNGLVSAEGLTLPRSVGGNLNLYSLTSAEGLSLPDSVAGSVDLYSLTSAKGLILPKNIEGDLYLTNLTSTNGLTLPNSIGGSLNLHSLTLATGLRLPDKVGGGLDLGSLISATDLNLPESIGGLDSYQYLVSTKLFEIPKNIRKELVKKYLDR